MKKIVLILLTLALLSCQSKYERTFSFDLTQIKNKKLDIIYVNRNKGNKLEFEITDTLIVKEIIKKISSHSSKEYVDFMELNFSDYYFDFHLNQFDNNEYLISTGKITKPNEKDKGFVYIFRKTDNGYIPEGRYYDDKLPNFIRRVTKR